MKFEIKKRFSLEVLVSVEIEATETDTDSVKLGKAVKAAYLGGADLRGADLGGADLGGADLRGADLRGADLGGADLRGAYLGGAYLGGADLGGADLRGADLRGAYLGGAKSIVSFGPIGNEGRIAYAVQHEKSVMVALGCFWGTDKEAIKKVTEKYGAKSEYVAALKLCVKILSKGKIKGENNA